MVVVEKRFDVVCSEHIRNAIPLIVEPLAEVLRNLARVKDAHLRLRFWRGFTARGEDGGEFMNIV